MILSVAIAAVASGEVWLFPSLGPTAWLAAETPQNEATTFYSTIVGHAHGLLGGFGALWILGASSAPAVIAFGEPVSARMWASALAIFLNVALGFILRARHAPSAATTLLVTVGVINSGVQALGLFIGVLIVTTVGEVFRHLRMGRIRQWQPAWPWGSGE